MSTRQRLLPQQRGCAASCARQGHRTAPARQPLAAAALALLTAMLTTLGTETAQAAAQTDGSVGAVQSLSGQMVIPQTLGTVRGGNLFHSFTRFGIAAGETATFTTVDPGLRHVVSRVTGGEASVLQGPLALQAAGGARPDFWLLNPSGILVGAGAAFDLPAGLHLSTAPQLRFADGFVWDARSASGSSLTIAAPESFGFLPGQAAAPMAWQGTNVALPPGGALTLAAGELVLSSSLLVTTDAPARIDAASLTATGAAGASGGLLVQTTGTGGNAALDLRLSGALTMGAGGLIRALNFGATAAAPISIEAASATLAGGAELSSFTLGTGNAADLRLTADTIRLQGAGSGLLTRGLGGGAGGIQMLARGALEVTGGAGILSVSSGAALPGEVNLQAGTLTLQGSGSSIGSLALGGTAAAAHVRVAAGQRLVVSEGAEISSSTLSAANGGSVQVAAPVIDLGGNALLASGISTTSLDTASGHAGALTVQAGRLNAGAGAQIASLTVSEVGNAGDVTVRADTLRVDGAGASAVIQSFAGSDLGNAGAVRIEARESLSILQGGAVTAGTLGFGGSGSVSVSAGTLTIDGRRTPNLFTGIGATGQSAAASAPITIDATRVELRDGGVITTISSSAANAGTITLTADSLSLDGSNLNIPTAISSDSVGAGNAGRIDIRAREVRVANRSFVSSSTLAGGGGGTIRIDAQALTVDAGGISTDAFGSGDAGSIDLRGGALRVTNLGLVSSSTRGTGRGGAVGVTASSLTVDGAAGIFSLALGAGDAGRVDIGISGSMLLADGGKVTANTAAAGAGGQVNVSAGTLTITGRDADGFPSGISGRALPGSSGRPGNLSIDVAGTFELGHGGILNIANEARVANPGAVAPATLSVRAGELNITDAAITAASSENVNAGRIAVTTAGALRLTGAAISTSALDGDGGPITLTAGGLVLLKNSGVSTSVNGVTNGNGGDITITGPALALASGFVLANTAAPQAQGGNVAVNVGLLVPDGSNVFVGGSRILAVREGLAGYNVIQAAAPNGVAGQLDLTRPELNLAGGLLALFVPVIDFGLIGRDICAAGTDSSFTVMGGGALPAPASAPLRLRARPAP